MTWYRNDKVDSTYVTWKEEYPGHHKIELKFNLVDLKSQLNLVDKQ